MARVSEPVTARAVFEDGPLVRASERVKDGLGERRGGVAHRDRFGD